MAWGLEGVWRGFGARLAGDGSRGAHLLSGLASLTSTCHCLPSALTTRPSMGRRQAPQMGTPILSWQGRQ